MSSSDRRALVLLTRVQRLGEERIGLEIDVCSKLQFLGVGLARLPALGMTSRQAKPSK